jgi:hypothetical protein
MTKVSNKKKTATDVYTILAAGWFSLEELPEYFSFRCLIKFKEFGTDGIDKNHVSTGYWWHRDKVFSIDNKEMRNFTPEYFIPIYSDIT